MRVGNRCKWIKSGICRWSLNHLDCLVPSCYDSAGVIQSLDMIAPSNGEVSFKDGLCIKPFAVMREVLSLLPDASRTQSRELPIQGWRQFKLGMHESNHGAFEVETSVGSEDRVEAVFLSHCHSFYDMSANGDPERRIFHEGVIATELRGQREFSWGYVFCKLERTKNRDWLVVVFNPYSNVPKRERREAMILTAHEEIPRDATEPIADQNDSGHLRR